jgi:hypothetical protein
MQVASLRRAKQSNWRAMTIGEARCEAQWLGRHKLRWVRVESVGGGTDRGVLERAIATSQCHARK